MSETRRPDPKVVGDCVHCGFCLPACPTYSLWGEEMDSPRGRIHLIDQVINGAPVDDVLTGHLDACLGCLACVPACPSGVRYDLLIGAARAQVEEEHRRPLRERLLRSLIFAIFPHPARLRLMRGPLYLYRRLALDRLMRRIAPRLALLARLAPEPRSLPDSGIPSRGNAQPESLGTARQAGSLGPHHDAGPRRAQHDAPHIPAHDDAPHDSAHVSAQHDTDRVSEPADAPQRPGTARPHRPRGRTAIPERTPATGTTRARVGMLTGCVQREFFPEVNAATVRVLAAEGVEVIVPKRQGCCGALSWHSGRDREARGFAQDVVTAFRDVDVVVANAAGCGSALKEYAEILGEAPPFRVVDVAELLHELGPVAERHPLPLSVAYHDACHLANAQGIRTAPRALLRQIPGLTLHEIPDAGMCCGSAGVYNVLNPAPAADLGDRKADAIAATGADLLVTANPGCLLQIADAFRRRGGTPPRLAHTIEVLDRAISG
ncbi:(Fe-S)-binding protein [Catenuloplanes japonicus]|uniref:(Fe-S)-binding protein n=1 Tax=Catenuloplanes japonicus TaxID=33876 RepID=UPI00052748F6|nr:heterodisulfide reductase-related iron-sulfur binding cluster [Catenuloplanes japonicus]